MKFKNKSRTNSHILTRITSLNEVSFFMKGTEKNSFEDCRHNKFTTATISFLELNRRLRKPRDDSIAVFLHLN